MNRERNKTMVRDFLGELDKSLDAVDHFFLPDCVAHLPGTASPTDRAGFRAFAGMLYGAFPDLCHTVVEQVAENERVASLISARGTHRGDFRGISPTGREVVITDVIIVRIGDGRITELWAQFDVIGLLQQLGVTL